MKFKIIHQLNLCIMNYKVKTLALLLAVAAGNSARAQQATYAQGCKSYTFIGTPAAGSGDITYQWYRNGQPIPNANGKDYTLPLKEAYGENVEFKRGVMSSGCPGEVAFSTPFYLTFSGLKIDTLCWAHTNVDAPNTFATKPDMYTSFYQWNRLTAWAGTGTVSGWNSTPDTSATWTVNPCPAGWRLPDTAEFRALFNVRFTWNAAQTRGNEVGGRFFGPNYATCSLPSNMVGCIFLPVAGVRDDTGKLLQQSGIGYYWSSLQGGKNFGLTYNFYYVQAIFDTTGYHKEYGLSIRCVQ